MCYSFNRKFELFLSCCSQIGFDKLKKDPFGDLNTKRHWFFVSHDWLQHEQE